MRKSGIGLLMATVAVACGDGTGTSLTMADVAGSYQATTFESELGGATEDQLALGATIQITLTADGNTSGQLFVPGGNSDGSDFTADLAGMWTLSGQAVRLLHATSTFLRDIVFAFESGRLTGQRVDESTGMIIRVVLAR